MPYDPEVSRLSKDIILKRIVDGLRGDFFAHFGLQLAPIVAALPTELPVLEVRGQRSDLLFLLADGTILHLEFQTTKKGADLLRFALYNLAVWGIYKCEVYTVVLHGPGISNPPDVLRAGSVTFQVRNLLLGQEDGEAVLQRLQAKEARGEGLTAGDRIDMVLLPLMRHRRPLEDVLREVAEVAQRLPRAQQEETIGAMVGLAYHYVDEAVSAALLEALRMSNALDALLDETVARGLAQGIEQGLQQGLERGLQQGMQQGMQQGEVTGERRLLRRYLQQRFGAIPAPLDARIEQANAETLVAMFDQALVSRAIDELARPAPDGGVS